MSITLRKAHLHDSAVIAALIQELAETSGEKSPITQEYVRQYFSSPSSNIWLAVDGDAVLGLLSYSIRQDLYHAAPTCLIEELIVRAPARSRGIGGLLIDAVVSEMKAAKCAEVSVSTMLDNTGAIRFYKRHGFGDEALLLERHLFREE